MTTVSHMPIRRKIANSRLLKPTIIAGFAGIFIALLSGPVSSQPPPVPSQITRDYHGGLWGRSALGGYLGPWFSSDLTSSSEDQGVHLSANATAFHLEFFYQPKLTGILNLDLSAGAVSRGDMRIRTSTESSFGMATIYPMGLGVRLAPLAKSDGLSFQPIFRLGGTLLVGTEHFETALTFPNGTYYGTSTQSYWALGYYGGGGIAWMLGERFAMSAFIKYQHARFTKDVFGARDYSGIQMLIGAMYLYRPVVHKRFNH